MKWKCSIAALVSGFLTVLAQGAQAATISILHTNDLHAHFSSEKTPLRLGGLARLKTAIDRARAQAPGSLLVDAGDWAEGTIYYVEGGGRESLKLMDVLGYDAAVIGNHDWYNGPDVLLQAIREASPRVALLGENFITADYAQKEEFDRRIVPSVIKEVAGVKVAIVGLVNSEALYGRYLRPIDTFDAANTIAEVARDLKSRADVVIALSHNSLEANRQILQAAPDLDLVIGGHDHAKLTHPWVVERAGRPAAWIVEAGAWGEYLGRVDLEVSGGQVRLKNYALTQIDRSIEEDAAVAARVAALEARIESARGAVFHDAVADSTAELGRGGAESPLGDLVADAYRQATGADLAVEQSQFIYGELHPGSITTSDIFSALAPIYDFATGRTWTLQTFKIKGEALERLLKLVLTWKRIAGTGTLNLSGARIVYDPSLQRDSLLPGGDAVSAVLDLRLPDRMAFPERTYTVATSAGVVSVISMIDALVPGAFPIDELTDTGKQCWEAVAEYLKALSPVTPDKVNSGGRLVTQQPDLGIRYDDVQWTAGRRTARGKAGSASVTVTNFGNTASPAGAKLRLLINANGADFARDPVYLDAAAASALPSLAPGESTTVSWYDVEIPRDRGVFPLTARVETSGETDTSNDQVTHYFGD